MGKRLIQGCMAGCEKDCYFFGCQELNTCPQRKDFFKAEHPSVVAADAKENDRSVENGG